MTPAIQAARFTANSRAAPAGGAAIPALDPSDGQIFAYIAYGNPADIETAVQAARTAYDGSDAGLKTLSIRHE